MLTSNEMWNNINRDKKIKIKKLKNLIKYDDKNKKEKDFDL